MAARATSPMMVNDSFSAILGCDRNIRHRPMAGRTAFVARIVVVAREQWESGVSCVSVRDVVREHGGAGHARCFPLFRREHIRSLRRRRAEPMPSMRSVWAFEARK